MRVLFSSTQAYGHLLPMMPLARAFRARGDAVGVLTADTMADMVEPEALDLLAAGPPVEATIEHAGWALAAMPPSAQVTIPTYVFGRSRIELAGDDSLAVARTWRPDLIISEICDYIGPLVAAALDVPWARFGYGPGQPAELTAAMDRLAVPQLADRGLALTPARWYVDSCPPSFNTPGFQPVAETVLIRPEAYRQPWVAPGARRAKSHRPRVLVTFGTLFKFTQPHLLSPLLRDLSSLDVDIIATLGLEHDESEFDVDPERVTFVPFAPFDELLDGVDVVVSHGGAGTILGALAKGIPLVVLPKGAADHPRQAESAVSTGVGFALPEETATAEAIVRAVNGCLTDSAIRANVARMAQEIADMPSPDEVAKLLAETVSQSRS